tara:strand:- start:634 stop:933 length:300 start_codon:yes stop_codon:yes gene_type:complete
MTPEHKKGAISKIAVMKLFAQLGYHVYNEMSNIGPVDFVAIHPYTRDVKLIDVKTMSFRSETSKNPGTLINRVLSPIQKELGVRLVYHNIETGEIKVGW